MRFVLALFLVACASSTTPPIVGAPAPIVGAPAPKLQGETQDGQAFDLTARKGQWTVLYFYPKDGTPGCTKQACAFRDATKQLTDLGVTIYGISRDSKASHQKFIAEHKLPFALIADESGKITTDWGVSGAFGMSKRWTFLVDPNLVVREVKKDVDPAVDAAQVAASVQALQKAQ